MINKSEIGGRIKEQRKGVLGISQQKLADMLLMHQPDISALEQGKKGSGIDSLDRLDCIAEVMGTSPEYLIFGLEDKKMTKYYGDAMRIKASKRKPTKSHEAILRRLRELRDEEPLIPSVYECGPYVIYVFRTFDYGWKSDTYRDEDGVIHNPHGLVRRHHVYAFLDRELVARFVAAETTLMQHIFQPALQELQETINRNVLDVIDVVRTLNPSWAFWYFSEDGSAEQEKHLRDLAVRNDELRAAGQDRPILYVESAYVREDRRRYGLMRMFVDLLKIMLPGAIMWLNLEPVSPAVLTDPQSPLPFYTVSDVGQISTNGAIAEKLGFTVDPDAWRRDAEVVGPDGEKRIETIRIRKCAYMLPPEIAAIVANDGDAVERGRAIQRLSSEKVIEGDSGVDVRVAEKDSWLIVEIGHTEGHSVLWHYAAKAKDSEEVRMGVSHRSTLDFGLDHDGQIEAYSNEDDFGDSAYYDELNLALMFLAMYSM